MNRYLIFILFFIFTDSVYSQIKWLSSLEEAKSIALDNNKIILIYFTASWCPSCKLMDENIWSDKEVDSITNRFVMVKLDIDDNPKEKKEYNVSSLPCIILTNPWNDTYHIINGYMGQFLIAKMLITYPENISLINEQYKKIQFSQNLDYYGLYHIGLAYQEYLSFLKDPAMQTFYEKSIGNFRKAEKIAKKSKQKVLEEKAILAQYLSQIIIGQEKVALNKLIKSFKSGELEEVNQPFACYILALGYYKTSDILNYEIHREKLSGIPGGKHFQSLLHRNILNGK